MKQNYTYYLKLRTVLFILLTIGFSAHATSQDYTENNVNYYIQGSAAYVGASPDASGAVTILDKITVSSVDYPVTSIATNAFLANKNITSVVIPNSVTSIGNVVFGYCSALTTVEIGSGVTHLGMNVFTDCTSITSFSVAAENTAYKSVSGVLYTKDGILMNYPAANKATAYTVAEGTTSILSRAFRYCTNLTTLSMPNSVTYVGESAFWGCSGLTSVTLSSNLAELSSNVFRDCVGLTSLTIPKGVTSIRNEAFIGCSKLASFSVAADNMAFKSIDGVIFSKDGTSIVRYPQGNAATSFTIPNSVTSIGSYAFFGASNLITIIIPASVTAIPEGSFYGCTSLASVVIPEGVTAIGANAFSNCTSLISIVIPDAVTTLGLAAFQGCSGLKTVTIGSGVTSMIRNFYGCKALDDVYCFANPETLTWMDLHCEDFKGEKGSKETVCHVADADAFKAKWGTGNLDTDVNVTFVGDLNENITFADATVKQLCVTNWDKNGDGELSKGEAAAVTALGTVFKSNKDITSFNELAYFVRLTTIGYSAFSYSSLTSVTIPNSVVSIMDDAFSMCTSLQDIVIPDNVTSIGKGAFTGCTAKKFTIGRGLISIGQYAFRWTELESFEVSPSNTAFISVDGVLFSKDIKELIYYPSKRAASSYTVPSTVTKIDDYAFFKCELGTINVPASVTEIVSPPYVFYSESLKNIVVEEGNSVYSSIDGVLFDKEKSTLICYPKGKEGAYTIPDGVTTIEPEAFNTADNLTEIIFPEGFTTIKVGAFYYYSGKGFTTVTLPASLTSIGDGAFHCDILETVHMKGTLPPEITGSPFIPSPNAIYVPRIAVDTYKTAWPKLADRIFANPDDIPTGSFSISNVEDGVLNGDDAHLVVKLNNPANYDQKGYFGFSYYYTEDMILGYSWWPTEDRNEVVVKPGENTYEFDRTVESVLPAKFVAFFYPEGGDAVELGFVVINSQIASGIQTIIDDSHPYDVFDLRGNKVASKVKSLQGLPKGVYIINGKKVMKK